jgi:hypothetical protein
MKSAAKILMWKATLVLSLVSATAHSTPVLDQSFGEPPFNMYSEFHDSIQQAQTFRAGITGSLVRLDILGMDYPQAGPNPAFFLDIRGVTNSHPNDAVVFQTVRVPGFLNPETPGTLPESGFISIPLAVPVTAGEMLSFVIYGGYGAIIGINTHEQLSTLSGYPLGRHWTAGTPPFGLEGSGSWYPDAAGTEATDLAFRTYVEAGEIPEPATLGLALIGLAAVGICSRKNT